MKIKGREIKGKNRKTLVLPREDGDDIIFVAEAVTDLAAINDILTIPEPPVVQRAGGVIDKNVKDPGYIQQVIEYNAKRMVWVILHSLAPSEIEWEIVDIEDPKTYLKFEEELREAGFSPIEVSKIQDIVLEANALDDEKLEAARQVFLRGQAAARKNTSGPSTPPQSSQSGEPASDGG